MVPFVKDKFHFLVRRPPSFIVFQDDVVKVHFDLRGRSRSIPEYLSGIRKRVQQKFRMRGIHPRNVLQIRSFFITCISNGLTSRPTSCPASKQW